jgi:metal-responsive CopG/Arc/MetJ family transcriptional regulator
MGMVRMSITIPAELAHKLDEIACPRKKSQFIAESLRKHMEKIEQEELQVRLAEGYKAGRAESLDMAKEFESVDLEGWDEY